ncbi:SDR family oxidoreductase [Algoriphagus aestuariicola]|uniref:SDR family oxidoreductase n=1 Tax=Algoriphagus aestuariicola TaxID=1852016 RepID=A0ABS3BN87_9BACT|nr:SDR family oxidoreductase [Algoriphagus aestuariicola]MBN7800747.1 SDR family oxidoreductase [Algoriphagus aestuariicola]
MKILLTGATGYIGRRLLPVLIEAGHQVFCLLRDKRRFDWDDFSEEFLKNVSVVEADLNEPDSLKGLISEVDVAFYLVHSMSSSDPDFQALEAKSAQHFVQFLDTTSCKHLIYLSGIVNDANLSDHLLSRKNVEDILAKARAPLTVLRAAIIIGSGSASFEIIRDLVEKLPVMVAPKWLNTRCQPIGIRNVVEYLSGVMMKPQAYNQTFDIGGTEILTYKQMLLGFAKVRGLKRVIITVPVLTPKLSSLWLLLVTSTTFSLARSLVSSMKNEVVCRDNRILEIVPIKLNDYMEALQLAFDKISQKNVVSTWKDSISLYGITNYFNENMQVPEHGVFTDQRSVAFERDKEEVIENIWSIGGNRGWYFGNWMWNVRGSMDILVGGVGIRRGRRSDTELWAGDALDFWRVLVADRSIGRLLLYAEMKLPGEAWLEFKFKNEGTKTVLQQTATFRPLGLWGRLYWYSVLPFHALIFPKMLKNIVRK